MWVAQFDKEELRPIVFNSDVGVKMILKGADMIYAQAVANKLNTPNTFAESFDMDDGK